MTLDELYKLKGQLITQIAINSKQLRQVNKLIMESIKVVPQANGQSPNVIESERIKTDFGVGSKMTLRYPTNEPSRSAS